MKKLIFILLILFTTIIFPQGQGAVPFLTLQQSPLLQGAGQTGVAIITDDPIGFYYNPAILGVTAQSNHVSTLFMTNNADWLGYLNLNTNSYGFNIGYNLKKNIPLSVGIGFIHNLFSYNIPSYFGNEESFNSFSLGASLNYPVIFSLGFSIKKFNSTLGGDISTNYKTYEASEMAYDFGALVSVPISNYLLEKTKYDICDNLFLTPKLNFVLGYSITNIGNEIYYIDPAQSDPIPRTAKLGYSINLGADFHLDNKTITAFDYTFVAEASDLLPESDSIGNTTYKGLLGDISIGKNLIQLKYTNNTIIHKAHIFNIFETVKFAFGNYVGKGLEYNPKTSAFVISTKGLFKLLDNGDNTVLGFILKHLGLEYTHSTVFKDIPFETTYNSISIFYNNFEL